VKTFSDPIIFELDLVEVISMQHSDDRVTAVYDRKPTWKHTTNPNTDPNPSAIPNRNTYFLLQSR